MTSDSISEARRSLRIVSGLYGVLMIIFGLLALAAPMISTLATVLVIGCSVTAAGVVGLIATFSERKDSAVWLHGLWSVLAIGLGIWMIARPGVAAVSLTLLLGAVFVARGIASLLFAFQPRFGQARIWLGLSGLLGLVLGCIVLFNLMEMAGLTLGTIVGVDFLFSGVALLLASMMGRRAA